VNRWIILICVFLGLGYKGIGQDKKSLYIVETYSLESIGTLERCEIKIPIPVDYPQRQEIKNITYSESPRFLNTPSTRFAFFELSEGDLSRISDLVITIEIDIFDYDLSVAKHAGFESELRKGEQKRYLKPEEYIN